MAPFLTAMLMCESSLEVQLTLLLLNAAVWRILIPLAAQSLVEPFINSKPWRHQWVDLNQRTFKSSLGIDLNTDDAYHFACESVPILAQHAVGGALCVPSLMGWFSLEVRVALACHGALCEAGWELQDGLSRAWQVNFGSAAQKRRNPTSMLVIMGLHHMMGLGMVVPMNLHFPGLVPYHEGIFLLQFAAFAALMTQNYGYTLDVGTAAGLLKMRIITAGVFATMFYSRAARFVYVVFQVVSFLYAEGGPVMFCGSIFASVTMSLLNALFVMDAGSKLLKFFQLKKEAGPKMLRKASSSVLVSACGFHGVHQLTAVESNWAKVRGAFRMGVLKGHRD